MTRFFARRTARSLAPPFIFMTAFGQIDQAVALVRAGAQDYLTKPFELASLFQKVRDVLSLRVRDGRGHPRRLAVDARD